MGAPSGLGARRRITGVLGLGLGLLVACGSDGPTGSPDGGADAGGDAGPNGQLAFTERAQSLGAAGDTVPTIFTLDPVAAGRLSAAGEAVVAAGLTDGLVRLYRLESGAFEALPEVDTGLAIDAIELADVDADGRTDLLAFSASDQALVVAAGSGDGHFAVGARRQLPGPILQVVVADVVDDGRPELVLLVGEQFAPPVAAWLGRPISGGFSFERLGDVSTSAALAVGDLTGDGRNDIVAGEVLFAGTESGTFAAAAPWGPEAEALEQVRVVAADIDSDADLDLVEIGGYSADAWRNGAGGFAQSWSVGQVIVYGQDLAVEDLDLDGARDIVAGIGAGMLILRGAGDGTFEEEPAPQLTLSGGRFDTLDLDRDGDLDLVALDSDGDGPRLVVQLNQVR